MITRQIRTRVPALDRSLETNWPGKTATKQAESKAKAACRNFYSKKYSATSLSLLQSGDTVRVKLDYQRTWSSPLKVTKTDTVRSYSVDTGNGKYRRDHKFPQSVPQDAAEPTVTVEQDIPALPEDTLPPGDPLLTPTTPVQSARSSGRATHEPRYLQDYVT